MRSTGQLLQQWRNAERIAAAAEALLITQGLAYSEGKAPAPAPTAANWEHVRQLRALANELFGEIMHSVTPSVGRGGPGTAQPLQ